MQDLTKGELQKEVKEGKPVWDCRIRGIAGHQLVPHPTEGDPVPACPDPQASKEDSPGRLIPL